jgi:hypothetical protein
LERVEEAAFHCPLGALIVAGVADEACLARGFAILQCTNHVVRFENINGARVKLDDLYVIGLHALQPALNAGCDELGSPILALAPREIVPRFSDQHILIAS